MTGAARAEALNVRVALGGELLDGGVKGIHAGEYNEKGADRSRRPKPYR